MMAKIFEWLIFESVVDSNVLSNNFVINWNWFVFLKTCNSVRSQLLGLGISLNSCSSLKKWVRKLNWQRLDWSSQVSIGQLGLLIDKLNNKHFFAYDIRLALKCDAKPLTRSAELKSYCPERREWQNDPSFVLMMCQIWAPTWFHLHDNSCDWIARWMPFYGRTARWRELACHLLQISCHKPDPIGSDPIQCESGSIISAIVTITFKNPTNSHTIFDNDHCHLTSGEWRRWLRSRPSEGATLPIPFRKETGSNRGLMV